MIIWAALLALAASALGGVFLARFGWPFELAASLLPQLGAVALLLTLSLFLLGRPGSAVGAAAIAALCAYGARDLLAPASPPLEQRDVRIVWANLLGERDAFERVVRLAEAQHADLIVVAEFPTSMSAEAPRVAAGPYVHQPEPMQGVNVRMFSRLPLMDAEAIHAPQHPNRQGLAVTLETASGPLRVLGVHPAVPLVPHAQRGRDETIVRAASLLKSQGAGVLMGDFNTVPWSPAIRAALADGALTRAQIGGASTWASPLPVLGLPIDHAFAANGAHIAARVGPGVGSDHLPLIIDVALPR
jgi:endonuclease/exonuclease/phosphatase (EEP) superfamily protein YafD